MNWLILIYFYLTSVIALTTSSSSSSSSFDVNTKKYLNEVIKKYNKFDNGIKYEEWKSPNGELYVIPNLSLNTSNLFQFGYHLMNNKQEFQSLSLSVDDDDGDYSVLKEQNLQALGFPNLWEKLFGDDCIPDEEEEEEDEDVPVQEDFFPFGAKKFLLVGIKKQSMNSTQGEEESPVLVSRDVDSKLSMNKFPFWKKKPEEDDCDDGEEEEDSENRNLFDTHRFLFVGIGSINSTMRNTSALAAAPASNRTTITETLLKHSTIHITETTTKTIHLTKQSDIVEGNLTSVSIPTSTLFTNNFNLTTTTSTVSQPIKSDFITITKSPQYYSTIIKNNTFNSISLSLENENNDNNLTDYIIIDHDNSTEKMKNGGGSLTTNREWSFLSALILIGFSVLLF
ncbi:hypothetical protein CANARDRAFT_136934 [[Candida] arabinofermentans NRRL YB-2248]|uniref:Uncharacterized protein n=1 Tax=[Candida] arabinofermentans NRRL YB-2248 TaxID=983967 RepID=A0A1E4T462_9ASCO|nr:hypothetical protein CANARDRAFT_136934 [[Candida] arabinofermentans NRRL YB-2248]